MTKKKKELVISKELRHELEKLERPITYKDVMRARSRLVSRRYRERNREAYNKYHREYRLKNAEKIREQSIKRNKLIVEQFNKDQESENWYD